jgi:hypothetical protein
VHFQLLVIWVDEMKLNSLARKRNSHCLTIPRCVAVLRVDVELFLEVLLNVSVRVCVVSSVDYVLVDC